MCIVEVEVNMATAFEVFKASAHWEREPWQNAASRRSNLSYGTHAGQNGKERFQPRVFNLCLLLLLIFVFYFTVLYSNE